MFSICAAPGMQVSLCLVVNPLECISVQSCSYYWHTACNLLLYYVVLSLTVRACLNMLLHLGLIAGQELWPARAHQVHSPVSGGHNRLRRLPQAGPTHHAGASDLHACWPLLSRSGRKPSMKETVMYLLTLFLHRFLPFDRRSWSSAWRECTTAVAYLATPPPPTSPIAAALAGRLSVAEVVVVEEATRAASAAASRAILRASAPTSSRPAQMATAALGEAVAQGATAFPWAEATGSDRSRDLRTAGLHTSCSRACAAAPERARVSISLICCIIHGRRMPSAIASCEVLTSRTHAHFFFAIVCLFFFFFFFFFFS